MAVPGQRCSVLLAVLHAGQAEGAVRRARRLRVLPGRRRRLPAVALPDAGPRVRQPLRVSDQLRDPVGGGLHGRHSLDPGRAGRTQSRHPRSARGAVFFARGVGAHPGGGMSEQHSILPGADGAVGQRGTRETRVCGDASGDGRHIATTIALDKGVLTHVTQNRENSEAKSKGVVDPVAVDDHVS